MYNISTLYDSFTYLVRLRNIKSFCPTNKFFSIGNGISFHRVPVCNNNISTNKNVDLFLAYERVDNNPV